MSFNHVARLEALDPLLPGEVATGETVLVQPGALIASTSSRLDDHCRFLPSRYIIRSADTNCIQCVGLRNLKPRTVVLGLSA